jgi:hypothetical protein
VFTHFAITPRPRQHDQPAAARLALPIRLSVDPEKGDDMADDKKEKKDGKGEGDGEGAKIKALIEALREIKLTIPDEVTDMDGLIIAVKASGGSRLEEDGVDPVIESTDGGGTGGAMALSLEKQTKAAEKMARNGLLGDIKALAASGRITPAIRADLEKRATAIRLSFDAEGELQTNDVLAEVRAYQKLPKGQNAGPAGGKKPSTGPTRLSNVEERDVGIRDGDPEAPDDSPEAQKARMDAWDEMRGAKKS